MESVLTTSNPIPLYGRREQRLSSFNFNALPGYNTIKEPITVVYNKIKKNNIKQNPVFLEDSYHKSVDFNKESLTFTIQISKI